MRVFKSRVFAQFCRKNDIGDDALREIIRSMVLGAIDADLGEGVYKQRLRRKGQGKSGGYRTIVLIRFGGVALFAYGFAKNDRANIDRADLIHFRNLAKEVLNYDDKELDQAVLNKVFEEIELEG
jgi:hypothetical protein